MQTVLEMQDVRKVYGQEAILAGVNFQVRSGEMVSIIGESGTGKTTLLSIAGLLQNPTAGQVVLAGNEVAHLAAASKASLRSQYIGFVFQRARLVGSLTALENVLVPAWLFGKDKSLNSRAELLLRQLGLAERLDYLPEALSIGQIRRVALARALLLNPDLILADEPTNDLDSATADVVFECLKQAQANGAAVILVTHDERYAFKADQVLKLQQGMLGVAVSGN